jgi:integrase
VPSPSRVPESQTQVKKVGVASVPYLFSSKLEGCSDNVKLVAQASLAESTKRQYAALALKFVQFLALYEIDDSDINECTLMDFISEFVVKKVSHSYVRQLYATAYRVALHENPLLMVDQALLSQVLAGAKNLCSVPKPRSFSWDPNDVLAYIQSIPVPESVKDLAAECALLLALATALRVSDLNRLGSEFSVNKGSFSIPFVEKTKTGFRDPISVKPLEGEDRVCPFVSLKRYLEKSRLLCSDNSIIRDKFLFVSATTGKRVKVPTIRNWIVELLKKAGILASAGSTRSAAASDAWWKNLSFDSIAKMAGWKRESTFQKFYKRPISFAGANLMKV